MTASIWNSGQGNGNNQQQEISLPDYAALIAYNGLATHIMITGFLAASAPSDISGLFVLDPKDVTSVANGGTILRDALGRCWKRKFLGPVCVEWFGAVGDWNGNTGTDSTAAIQAAVNASSSVKFKLAQYMITGTIVISKFATELVGEGNKYSGSIIHYKGNGVAINFANGTGYNGMRNLAIHGYPNVPTDYYNTGSVGVDLAACNVEMYNCWIKGFQYGVRSNYDSYYNKFIDCRFENLNVCLYRFSVNNLNIRGCRALQFNGFLYSDGNNGVANIINNSFEVFNGYLVYTTSMSHVVFKENYVEIVWNSAPPTNFPLNPLGLFTDAILFTGYYRSLIIKDNNLQLNGARRIVNAFDCKRLVSEGNTITDFVSGSFIDQLYSVNNPCDYVHIEDVLNSLYDNNVNIATGRVRGQSFIPISGPDKHFHYYDAIQAKEYLAAGTAGSYPKIYYPVLINGWVNGEGELNKLKLRYTPEGIIISGVLDGTGKTDITICSLPTPYMAKAIEPDTKYFRFTAHNNYDDQPNESISIRYLYGNGDLRLESAPAAVNKLVLDNVFIPHM